MPPALIAAAIVGASASAATLAWVTLAVTIIESIAISVVLGAVSGALAKKPKGPSAIGVGTDRSLTIRQPIISHQIIIGQVKTGGAFTFMRSFEDGKRLEVVITLAGHPCQSIDTVYFNDSICTLDGSGNVTKTTDPNGVDNTNWNGYAQVVAGLGSTATDANFMTHGIAAAPGIWTSNHKQTGRTKIWVTFKANSQLFNGGLPNISVVMSGLMPYDPRTTLSVYSTNPMLAVRYYLLATGIVSADLSNWDETVAIAGANTCDELITLAAGGTEKRYTANGLVDTANNPATNLPDLLNSMQAKLIHTGGKWACLVGAYRTPSISFSERDLDGPIKTTYRLSLRESFNAVKGTHYSPAAAYQPTDFPAVTNATYLAEDGGFQVFQDIQLPYTVTASMAQRIAKQTLESVRRQITTYWPCKLTAMQVQIGDVVLLNRSRYGWINKPFEVTNWQFTLRGSGADMRLGVDMVLRETDSGVYAWNSGMETIAPTVPVTVLPNPWVVGAPGAPSVIPAIYTTRTQTGVKAAADITWLPGTNAVAYQLEYQAVGDADWVVLPRYNGTTSTTIFDMTPGLYNFRVKAINYLLVESGYALTNNVDVNGLAPTPQNLTGFTLQAISSLASLHWDQSVDQDVISGGNILVRHTPDDISVADWGTTVSILQNVPGTANTAVAPLKAGTYMIKALNTSGGLSPVAAMASTKNATVLAFSNIGTVTESPNFTGTFSNCVKMADEAFIKLAGTGLFSTITDFDLLRSLDSLGGIVPAGTYTFAAGIDNGSVLRCHVITNLSVIAVNTIDSFDLRTGNVDTWSDWDQTPGGIVDAWIEERHTDDNPGVGTPTWTAWNRLVTGDFICRGFQFRLQMTTLDSTMNIHVTALGATSQQI